MRPQGSSFQSLVLIVTGLLPVLLGAREAAPQALHTERFSGGTELVFVTQALAGATTVAWPAEDGEIQSVTLGQLNLVPSVEAEVAAIDPPPPALVVAGGVQFTELRSAIERAVGDRPAAGQPGRAAVTAEGGIDRRLGQPDGGALIRLEMPLPAPDDSRRCSVEVLWEMLPGLLPAELPGFRSRWEGGRAFLEGRVDEELADVRLRQLRLAIARLGDSPSLDGAAVEAARSRLEVRRRALLGAHPDGAREILERWLGGGSEGVREFLFGIDGVTESTVREAARSWLPQHPGRVVLTLPPRVFNPRFAPGPEVVRLPNDATAAVLERTAAGLGVVTLRPILLPDVDGELTATVLARVAAAIRANEGAPGWVRVLNDPPLLELASSPDGLAESIEVLQGALAAVADDGRTVATEGGSARRRALQLMAGLLGLTEGGELSPATVLRPSNLAVGVVAPDTETAVDAVTKFGLGGSDPESALIAETVQPVPRTREAAPGGDSAVAVVADLGVAASDVTSAVAAEVVRRRVAELQITESVEVLRPMVPGRRVLLVLVQAPGDLDALEKAVAKAWPRVTRPLDKDEVDAASRAVASRLAADSSGPLGQARRCAAVAAGAGRWRSAEDLEREVLSISSEELAMAVEGLPPWQELETTGSGVLPVPASPSR